VAAANNGAMSDPDPAALMKAVVYEHVDGPLLVRTVPRPVPPAAGVVIDVRATGVCRSDWHAWRGHDPVALPHTPGHELAGVIAGVGEGVTRWRVGDRVVVPFVCGCGACEWCRSGDSQVCPNQTQPGFTHAGSFAEQVVIHQADHNLVALPEAIDFVTAASLGCRFATAYRALTGHTTPRPGQWVAVFGCGGVGLSTVMIAAALGLRVIGIDVSAAARELARSFGAEVTLDPADGDIAGRIQESVGGVHLTIDAIGDPAAAVTAVRSLRRRGRHVQVGLLLGADSTPPLPMDLLVAQELSVHGSHGMAAGDYPAMLEMIADGRMDPARLVGRIIGLAQAQEALAAMGAPPGTDVGTDGPRRAGMTVIDLAR